MAKKARTTAATTYIAGYPAPFPAAMPIGTDPAMTVNGAAAGTTMKTMDPEPSRPSSLWDGGRPAPVAAFARVGVGGGSERVAMRTSGARQRLVAGDGQNVRRLTLTCGTA